MGFFIDRWLLAVLLIIGVQNTSHSLPQKQDEGSRFRDCPHFFAGGLAPVVPKVPLVRELCYEAFAILHNGSTRTPVFVAQRLNRASILDADEKRTDKFFADARLPRAERAELNDYPNCRKASAF